MEFSSWLNESLVTIYRGESLSNRRGGKRGTYWTPDKEWARQFTQTGQDGEVKSATIDSDKILKMDPLPSATSEKEFDQAIELAKQGGYSAVWFDEGPREPNSCFVLN